VNCFRIASSNRLCHRGPELRVKPSYHPGESETGTQNSLLEPVRSSCAVCRFAASCRKSDSHGGTGVLSEIVGHPESAFRFGQTGWRCSGWQPRRYANGVPSWSLKALPKSWTSGDCDER